MGGGGYKLCLYRGKLFSFVIKTKSVVIAKLGMYVWYFEYYGLKLVTHFNKILFQNAVFIIQ